RRSERGRGWCAPYALTRLLTLITVFLEPFFSCACSLLYFIQFKLCGRFLFPITCFVLCSSLNILSDFCRLHVQWANCRLLMSEGCPFLATGMIWSTVALIGCGTFNVKST